MASPRDELRSVLAPVEVNPSTPATDRARANDRAARGGWGPAVFVWGVWALALLGVLTFIGSFGSWSPLYDDWELVPYLTRHRPLPPGVPPYPDPPPGTGEVRRFGFPWGWVWSQSTNEHRLPLPKLILAGLLGMTGADFRAGMVFNALALGALAAGLIGTARQLRGRTTWTDAFLPLAVLNLGQYENLLWSFQVQMVSSTVLAGVILLLVVRRAGPFTPAGALLAGFCLLLLPLCGMNGLALVPALVVWFGYAGVLHYRVGGRSARWAGRLCLAFAGLSLLVVGLYFYRYQKPAWQPDNPGLGAFLTTSLQLVSVSLGRGMAISGWPFAGLAVLGLTLAAAVVLFRVWSRQPAERLRASGLLCFLAALGCLAVGIGWGRSGRGADAGLSSRYVTLGLPLLVAVYFTFTIYAGRARGRFVPWLLFGLITAAVALSVPQALTWGEAIHAEEQAFQRDLAEGASADQLAEQHFKLYVPEDSELSHRELAKWLRWLKEAGYQRYQSLQEQPSP